MLGYWQGTMALDHYTMARPHMLSISQHLLTDTLHYHRLLCPARKCKLPICLPM